MRKNDVFNIDIKNNATNWAEMIQRYINGERAVILSRKYGVTRTKFIRKLISESVHVRSRAEQNRLESKTPIDQDG